MKPDNSANPIWPTTHWSLVGHAGHGPDAEKVKALASLITQYAPVLRKHLVIFRRIDHDEVDDILQEFVLLKFLEKEIVRLADQNRGRFRNFLIVSIDRFVQNRARDQCALKRDFARVVPLDDAPEPCDAASPFSTSFEMDWARQVIGRAIRRMRIECIQNNRPEVWAVFRGRILKPHLTNADPVSYAELVRQYHFVSPGQASNVLVTANRMFARALHAVVSAYEKDQVDIEQEIRDLWQAVSCAARRQWLNAGYLMMGFASGDISLMNRLARKTRLDLAPLMGVGCGHSILWQEDDLRAILEHQLNTPLICNLAPAARNSQDFDHLRLDSVDWTMTTFAELLQHPSPPLSLIRLAKDFAKSADAGPEPALPSNVALALYYATISIGLIHHGMRITSLGDEELKSGLSWVDQQPWIDSAIRSLACQALIQLDAGK